MDTVEKIKRMYADSPYVERIDDNGKMFYTLKFKLGLYYRIEYGGMDRIEAYRSFGFDTKIVGEARAKQAAYNAVKLGRKTFKKDISEYDATLSFAEMLKKKESGDYDDDDLFANMAAALLYHEGKDDLVKKNRKTKEENSDTMKKGG